MRLLIADKLHPRAIDAAFGAGELAAAAYCFRAGEQGCAVSFTARRHGAAELLTAEVRSARLATVLTRDGASMTRVQLALRVGAKRNLELRLPPGATLADLPARSAASDRLSKDLGRRGFRFVGSVIVYAFMQSVGLVDDHLPVCFRYRGGRG